MKKYVIWNPEKIAAAGYSASSYEELEKLEETSCSSWCSVIETSDIQNTINAIENETDVILSYHELQNS